MPARKMRVEVHDGDGNRYTVIFEGQITRDKALHLLDLIELLGGVPGHRQEWTGTANEFSKFDRLRVIIERHFPIVWFSSKDIQSVYEQEFKEPINLSTVSTYLARMVNRGILTKSGSSSRKRYRIMTEMSQQMLSLMKGK